MTDTTQAAGLTPEQKRVISETIGFGFELGELQSINEADLARLCAALAAQAVPAATQHAESVLMEVMEERDAASDYIDALLDEVLGKDRHEWTSNYGHADAMADVRERMAAQAGEAKASVPAGWKLAERWPEPQYNERQRQWCKHYEATTDFEPLMDDYEAGHETFVQAAQKSVQWYEDHTNDAYLAITREEIPGSEFDHGIKGE